MSNFHPPSAKLGPVMVALVVSLATPMVQADDRHDHKQEDDVQKRRSRSQRGLHKFATTILDRVADTCQCFADNTVFGHNAGEAEGQECLQIAEQVGGHVDQLTGTVHQIEEKEESAEKGVGPQIKADEREDVVSGQDDVDDLLSSLGF